MRDMKPYKSKEKRVLSSLSTNIQQPASLVDVQTMLLLKKEPHLVSPEPPNLNLCLSRSPLLSPGDFRKQIFLTTNEKAKRRKKTTRLTYQAAPKTETPTESAMPIAENTKGDM